MCPAQDRLVIDTVGSTCPVSNSIVGYVIIVTALLMGPDTMQWRRTCLTVDCRLAARVFGCHQLTRSHIIQADTDSPKLLLLQASELFAAGYSDSPVSHLEFYPTC